MSALQVAILRTLAYFDVLDFPLTVEELWRWLYPAPDQTVRAAVADVEAALSTPELKQRFDRRNDLVFFRGREALVDLRSARHEFGQKKWKRAFSGAQFLEVVPFVKMVAVSNTLAIDNAKESSDIDYLIVTSPGHIWLARTMVTGILNMLGIRRHGDKVKDRICLSFYVTADALDFRKIARQPDDPHRLFLTAQMVPLMDDAKTYEKFRMANAWVTERLPNAWEWDWNKRLVKPNSLFRSFKNMFEVASQSGIGQMLESMARDRQVKKMMKNVHSRASEPTPDVIISDEMLKFHENDRLAEYNARYAQRLAELGLRS